jgi:hypothetical protein
MRQRHVQSQAWRVLGGETYLMLPWQELLLAAATNGRGAGHEG